MSKELIERLRDYLDEDGMWRKGLNAVDIVDAADTIEQQAAEIERLRVDAERYRKAIAYEDNAGLLYSAVFNHRPYKSAIDAEFDAYAIDEPAPQQPAN